VEVVVIIIIKIGMTRTTTTTVYYNSCSGYDINNYGDDSKK
jgi:hypothetical protein